MIFQFLKKNKQSSTQELRDLFPQIEFIEGFRYKYKTGEDVIKDNVLKYAILMYDYESPFINQPEKERHKAVLKVALGYKDENKINGFTTAFDHRAMINKVKTTLKGMNRSIDCNENRALFYALKNRKQEIIDHLNKKNKQQEDHDLSNKFIKELKDVIENIETVRKLLGYEEEDEGLSDRSAIEKFILSKQK